MHLRQSTTQSTTPNQSFIDTRQSKTSISRAFLKLF